MCVMFVATIGQLIPSYALMKAGWDNNPHGAGFMYPDPDTQTLRIVKGLMTWTAFKDAFAKHRKRFCDDDGFATVDVAAHFRIRSHGPTNPAMTHPHVIVQDKIALMHNGIIRDVRPDAKLSDTAVFIEDILAKLPKGWHRNGPILELISGRIGQGNKFIIFDQRGLASLVNSKSGILHEGVWWSNGHHLRSNYHDEWGCEAPVMKGQAALAFDEPLELKPTQGGKTLTKSPTMVIKSATILPSGEIRVCTRVEGEDLELDVTLAQAEALCQQLKDGIIVSECALNRKPAFVHVVAEAKKRAGGSHASGE